MSLLMTFRIAFKALARNKMRTALTMLGMIIGVAAVIAMVALGTGARSVIEAQVKSAGTNLITISPGSMNALGVRTGFGGSNRMVPADADALREIPVAELIARVGRAGELYANAELPLGDGSLTPDEFVRAQSGSSGIPERLWDHTIAPGNPGVPSNNRESQTISTT